MRQAPSANASSGATRSNKVRLERSFIASIGPRIFSADLLPAQGNQPSTDCFNHGQATDARCRRGPLEGPDGVELGGGAEAEAGELREK